MTAPTSSELFWAAVEYEGTPYLYGSEDPAVGLDCSELVQVACRDVGVAFVDGSAAQYAACEPWQGDGVPPIGALLYRAAGNGQPSHDGLSDGCGGVMHAASPQLGVTWLDDAGPVGFTHAGLIPGIDYTEAVMAGSTLAVRNASAAVGKGAAYTGMCEKFSRTCFGFPARYPSAKLAYEASAREGKITRSYDAPAGVPVFWNIVSGVNAPYDHVAVSVGGGYCVSTSAGPGRTVAKVKIETLTKAWGMVYLGWGDVYHGKRVYTWPTKETSKSKYPSAPVGHSAAELKSGWYRLLGALGYTGATDVRQQKWLKASGHYRGDIDGDRGPMQIAALQTRLREAFEKTSTTGRLLDPGPADGKRGTRTKRAEAAYLNHLRSTAKKG